MKQRRNKTLALLISISVLFIACATSTQKKEVKAHCKVILVKSINVKSKNAIDLNTDEEIKINDEDTKHVENIIAVISNKKDSITIFNFESDLKNSPQKKVFISQRKDRMTRIYKNSEEDKEVQVEFKINNLIKIEDDMYILNKEYYEFLKEKILEDGSVLELVSLIKDGYGDYCTQFNPLIDYTWTQKKIDRNFKVEKVKVNSINYSGEIITPWEIIYHDSNAKSTRFNKNLIESNSMYNIYRIETTDERSIQEKIVYQNKKTTLDSIVGNWFLSSTNIEYKYTKYQSKLEIVEVEKQPKDIQSMLKLFQD